MESTNPAARTVTIKGVGRLDVRPDHVLVYALVDTIEKKYHNAIVLAEQQVEELRAAIVDAGFEPTDLVTTSLTVDTVYKDKKDRFGMQGHTLEGFVCHHLLKLEFPYSPERLSAAVIAISRRFDKPAVTIKFTVEDTFAVKEELMRRATDCAVRRAHVMCDAAGVKLGKLLSMDYAWRDLELDSDSNYVLDDRSFPVARDGREAINIIPENIHVKDSATLVWEIEDE